MIEKNLETGNGNICYWVSNDWVESRDTIFFFHGLTGNHTMFQGQYDYFEDKYNLITWDSPGHSKSKAIDGFSLEKATTYIFNILDIMKVKNIIAIGQSYGGYFPQAMMCRNPKVIRAFIGIGTTPYGLKYYSGSDYFFLKHVGFTSKVIPFERMKELAIVGAAHTQDGRDNMRQMLGSFDKHTYASVTQTYYDAFLADNQELDIECPCLIMIGEYDKVAKVADYSEEWHENTGFPLFKVSGSGHNANADNIDEVNEIIEKFIEEIVLN